MGNIHINSLNIETYRGIKNLKLDGFTGINILTGDNNCGKTSVLELLQVSGDPASPIVWSSLGRTEKYPNPTRTVFEKIRDLYDFTSPKLRIAYSITDELNGCSEVELKGTIEKIKTSRLEYCKEAHVECEKGQEYSEAEMIKLKSDIYYKGKLVEDDFEVFNVTRFDIFPENIEKPYKKYEALYLSPTVYQAECPMIKEVFDNTTVFKDLVEILRIFDEDIVTITPTVREYDIPFPMKNSFQILSEKYGKAVPLSVYGDGIKKALWLVTAVVASKNGVLLIDEFETAIHTSAMDKIFAWILKTCKKLNVQLFMTTHSKEALQKVIALDSDPELKDEITLFTLYRRDGRNIARKLSAERAIEADENFNQELR